jgi:hypothetical protein
MKRIFKASVLLVFFFHLCGFNLKAWAAPSASDLLQTAKSQTHVNCNTQHLMYKNSTIIQRAGQAPMTLIQTTEIFKKKPSLVHMIVTDNVGGQRDVISSGNGYIYLKDPTSGKYVPIKSPIQIDPFQDMNNTLSDFDSADAQAVTDASDPPGGHYEVTLRGGKMPKGVDHTTLKIDPQTNTVTHLEGKDVNGNTMLSADTTYQKIGNAYHPQHMHTETHTKNIDVNSDMDVVTDEVDTNIPDSTFATK